MSHMCHNVYSKGLQNNINSSSYVIDASRDGSTHPSESSSNLLHNSISLQDGSTTSTASLLNDNAHPDPEPLPHYDNLPPGLGVPFTMETDIIHTIKPSPLPHFSHQMSSCSELLYILMSTGAPLYAFDSIMAWAKSSSLHAVDIASRIPSRNAVMKTLETKFNTHNCKPQTLKYDLEGGGTDTVIVFDFISMLKSLLTDARLMSADNLVIDPSNPSQFQPQYALDDKLDELHQGTVCRNSRTNLCINSNDVFCGLVLYTDGTKLGSYTKGHLDPVVFSLTLFNRKTRNLAHAWRPLGFVHRPKDDKKTALDDNLDALKGRNTRNFHTALRLILNSIKKYQDSGGVKCNLDICGESHDGVVLKIPVVACISDCEEADDLCGRFKSHNIDCKSLCRDCNIPSSSADDVDFPCQFRKREDVINKTLVELKDQSHYQVDNTFDDILMCDPVYGISGASPPEILHWFQAGLVKLGVNTLYTQILGNGQASKSFDSTLALVSQQASHQSDRSMPPITFPNGFSKLIRCTIKTSDYTGLLLACVLTWHTHAAKSAYSGFNYLPLRNKITDFTDLFEMLLACEAWMKHGDHRLSTIDNYNNSFRQLMKKYKQTVDRQTGNGLKTTKFHQTAHIVWYIKRFGSPQNINSSRCENHHIENVKNPARTTQKRPSTLSEQTADRIYQKFLIDLSQQSLLKHKLHIDTSQASSCNKLLGTKLLMTINAQDGRLTYGINFFNFVPYNVDERLIRFLADNILRNRPNSCLTIGSEFRSSDNLIYRAHPRYRSKSSWHDFCYYQHPRMRYPRICKIMCFFSSEDHIRHPHLCSLNEIKAVVVRTSDQLADLSTLVQMSHLEYHPGLFAEKFSVISTKHIIGPAFAIQNICCESNEPTPLEKSKVLIVKPYKSWINLF